MRTLDPEVVDAIWETIEPLIPVPSDSHPLGCHRPQIPDRLCFWRMLVAAGHGVFVGQCGSDP